MPTNPFRPETLSFLGKLARNNNREWFKAHQDEYEANVREPALLFIRQMEPAIGKVSPHLRVSDQKVGGSLMRVHRDTRFARDKTPYKTNIGIHFRHEVGRDVHAPGLYVHIDPKSFFLGAGVWHPDAPTLGRIREHLDGNPTSWRKVRDDRRFRRHFELAGDTLQRPPRGYSEEHPFVDDLKRKDFIGVAELARADVLAGDFPRKTGQMFASARSFMSWLCDALELPF